jgi:SAM-dependent methyltransferase
MNRMMATYDLLAPHYDAVTGDAVAEAAFVRGIIERRHGQAATLLDLACGTGSITALLAETYQVSGLDESPGMLAVAREKLPARTSLYLADMTSFRLNAKFDAVVCAYQGLNHLLSLAAWGECFDSAYEHLNSGGLFVFDITTVGHLTVMASSPRIVQEFDGNYLRIRVRPADEMVFDWHIEVFELQPEGRYELLTQTVKLRSFPLADIRDALSARFSGVELIGDDGRPADEEDSERVWFACTRPEA